MRCKVPSQRTVRSSAATSSSSPALRQRLPPSPVTATRVPPVQCHFRALGPLQSERRSPRIRRDITFSALPPKPSVRSSYSSGDMSSAHDSLPKVLLSNDDGVAAPGLRALVAALHRAECCELYVCGPAEERSAQSHAITLKTPLEAWDIPIQGTAAAFAVDGTPADSVMLALNSDIIPGAPKFDLVIAGINRGDNAGLHVIYSGTVGAAREAACKGIMALSLSLDYYAGKSEEEYATAAELTVPIVKGMLGQLQLPSNSNLKLLQNYVVNINFPPGPLSDVKGYLIARQGDHCVTPKFLRIPEGEYPKTREHDVGGGKMEKRKVVQYQNTGGGLAGVNPEGTDFWAVQNGWASVCVVGLMSDVQIDPVEAARREAVVHLIRDLVTAAGSMVNMPCRL